MWELDHKEDWALKNWCFQAVVLKKALASPLDFKEIQPVNLKGNQSWTFIGLTDGEAQAPILWPPEAKSWCIGKDWCWKGLRAGEEGRVRGWDDWMASLTQWTWVWVNSGRYWKTGKPGVLLWVADSDTTEWLNNNGLDFNSHVSLHQHVQEQWAMTSAMGLPFETKDL